MTGAAIVGPIGQAWPYSPPGAMAAWLLVTGESRTVQVPTMLGLWAATEASVFAVMVDRPELGGAPLRASVYAARPGFEPAMLADGVWPRLHEHAVMSTPFHGPEHPGHGAQVGELLTRAVTQGLVPLQGRQLALQFHKAVQLLSMACTERADVR